MLNIRNATLVDLDRCFEIESVSYGLEGATKERIKYRIDTYPEGFLVAESNGVITGFINSCCSDDKDLSNEGIKAMVTHNPAAKVLIILSVVVAPECRDQGYAKVLLDNYLSFTAAQNKMALLMCKRQHIEFYKKFGFSTVKKSESNHGGIEWFEMSRAANTG